VNPTWSLFSTRTEETSGKFGEAEPIAERTDLNRYLNIGELATDGQGHLYYAFAYLPEPPCGNSTGWAMRGKIFSTQRSTPGLPHRLRAKRSSGRNAAAILLP